MSSQTSLLLGLDIGGTKSAAIIGDWDGNVLARVSALTSPGSWQEAVDVLFGLLREVCRQSGYDCVQMTGLGVSCGGPLDSATGIVYAPPNLPHWEAVPLKALLADEFGLPVFIENDANATALAEHRWGAGQNCRDMAFLTMGTGIGAGLILDGQLYRGRRDLAGEVGHATLLPDGPLCPCGKRGCLEALASGTAIGQRGRERYGEEDITTETICARARLGEPTARKILAEAAFWMGIGLANLLQTLNLERIVLGTLAVHAADLLLEPIREAARAHCWPRVWEGVSIVPAALGDAAQDKAALAVALATFEKS
ncbi:MAG: ROK family protein [Armatimonadota bacterium]|nr:ROK family protein [Armatimonadota bacterium]